MEKIKHYIGSFFCLVMLASVIASMILVIAFSVYKLSNPQPLRTGWLIAPLTHITGEKK